MRRSLLSLACAALLLSACGKQQTEAPHDAASPDLLIVPLAQRAALKLGIGAASEQRVEQSITVPATVIIDQDHAARVSSLLQGRVRRVMVRQGERVRAGQPLAVIESPELGALFGDVIRGVSVDRAAAAELARVTQLQTDRVASDKQLQAATSAAHVARAELEAARKKLLAIGMSAGDLAALLEHPTDFEAGLTLRAPIAGVITMRNAMVGQQAGPGDDLFEIVDVSSMTVEGSVFQADFPGLRTGQRASFEAQAFAEERFEGSLSFVASTVDERTHALAVRMRVANPRASLKPNMHGRLVINADLPRTVVSVPTDAIVYDGNNRFVFVALNDSTFRYVRVETGAEFGDRVEIRTGLRTGDRVVQSGVFNLKSQLKMSQAGDE